MSRSALDSAGVVVDRDLETAMRDGVVLRADAWRPSKPGRYPVLLMRLPYDKTSAEDIGYAHPSWYARHGYAVVVQDVRGRLASDGEFVPFEHEAQDTVDTIAWAAELPFSNGDVGTYGFSYSGALQLQAAVEKPPALRCIAPFLTTPDYYEGWSYNNGAFALAFCASWALAFLPDWARRRGDGALEGRYVASLFNSRALCGTLPLTAFPELGRDGPGGYFQDWVEHETKDEYWQRWDVSSRLGDIEVPALAVAGLYDVFLEGSLEIQRRTGAPLVLGPWHHMPWMRSVGALDFGPEARSIVDEVQLAFFDQHLRGGDEPDAHLRLFLSGADRWETFKSWPAPDAEWTLYLHARSRANSLDGDGRLDEEPPAQEPADVFSYDPLFPVPSLGGRSCCFEALAPMGPADQRPVEASNAVLVYTSDELPRDRTVLGMLRAHLFAATSAADTDWTVKVCDVHPDGRSINIQETIQRARFYGDPTGSRRIPAYEVTEFVLDVGTCAHVFRAGHRIRVEVSSSNFPHWNRNTNTGNPLGADSLSDRVVATQLVLHESAHPSRIVLPLMNA